MQEYSEKAPVSGTSDGSQVEGHSEPNNKEIVTKANSMMRSGEDAGPSVIIAEVLFRGSWRSRGARPR